MTNRESLNSGLIRQGLLQPEHLLKLNEIAITQGLQGQVMKTPLRALLATSNIAIVNVKTIMKRDFDMDAAGWDSNPVRMQMTLALAKVMVERLDLKPNQRVLDYGAGTGIVALIFSSLIAEVISKASDFETDQGYRAESQRRKGSHRNHKFPFELGSLVPLLCVSASLRENGSKPVIASVLHYLRCLLFNPDCVGLAAALPLQGSIEASSVQSEPQFSRDASILAHSILLLRTNFKIEACSSLIMGERLAISLSLDF
ncbi:MAG: hypothetical protein WC378_01330 [Opitutaceae bacterium]